MPNEAYIYDAIRTPRGRGKANGSLHEVRPLDLLKTLFDEMRLRHDLDTSQVDDVLLGCVTPVKEQGGNIARTAPLYAGWDLDLPGAQLNRFCASGLEAVNLAAMKVRSGWEELVVAGGIESMSRVPMGSDGGGVDGGNMRLRDRVFQVPQGISADLIATLEGFTREELDSFALASQQKAAVAIEQGHFAKSIFAVVDPATGKLALDRDEYPRADTTAEGLAGLKPAFVGLGAMEVGPKGETLDQLAVAAYPEAKAIEHVHTAGNSSGIVDGAAVVALASERFIKERGIKPRARIRAVATLGSEPLIMLTAPGPVSEKALKLAGMKASDIDLWEINEAFAAVVLQTIRKLEIDPARVNVNGGAIALGHPLGATGAMLFGTALDELERSGKQTALVTLCIGGGQGVATILERV